MLSNAKWSPKFMHHPVDGIRAAAADTDDLDDCEITAGFHEISVRTSS